MILVVGMARRRKKELTTLGKLLEAKIIEKFGTGTVGLQKAADASGLSTGTLKAWMRGAIEDPRVSSLKAAADALEIAYDDLCRLAVELPIHEPLTPEALQRKQRAERVEGLLDRLPDEEFEKFIQEMEAKFSAEYRRIHAPDAPIPIPQIAAS